MSPRPGRKTPSMQVMEARSVDAIPHGADWRYEPKWDGFRCLLSRSGRSVSLQSKSGEELTRYFPELVDAARALATTSFVLDGEIVVPDGKTFSFDALLQRIHPAESRVMTLSRKTPAIFIAFDLLKLGRSNIATKPLPDRRTELEKFAKHEFRGANSFRLSPQSARLADAERWLRSAGGGYDGVIAKRADLPYQGGNRDGMQKIKHYRSADCVVGGFRFAQNPVGGRKVVGSLLLGLYDDEGLLHHVGFTSAIKDADKAELTRKLLPLAAKESFTGKAPGGPSRWSTRRSSEWTPLRPELVVEVCYDHFSGDRFRHGTSILRWRPDKSPRECRMDQLEQKFLSPAELLRP
jgi:ATP-dependent DNA ligase